MRARRSRTWTRGTTATVVLASLLLAGLLPALPGGATVTDAGAQLSSPRSATSAVWTGDLALVFGGLDAEGDPIDEIFAYDPSDNTTQVMTSRLPEPLAYTSAVWDGRARPADGCPVGCVYLFGGQDAAGDPVGTVIRYNPGDDVVATFGVPLLTAAWGTSAVWTGAGAFVFGGRDAGDDPMDDIVFFDPVNETVRSVGTLPEALSETSAVWDGERAFIFGGHGTGTSRSRDTHAFHPQSGTATLGGSADLPSGRFGTSAVWDGELAYVFGGQTDDVAIFDPDAETMTLEDDTLPSPRTATSAVWSGRFAYVFGGEDQSNNELVDIIQYDPPNRPPIARFTVSVEGLTATVDGSGSSDIDGDISTYRWQWGDGTENSGNAVESHTYGEAGSYTITLTVTDSDGATRATSRTTTLQFNRAPQAVIRADTADLTVRVDAADSADPDGSIVSYTWDFGDDSPRVQGIARTHDYATGGTYTITLTVVDDGGATDTRTLTVEVGWFLFPNMTVGFVVLGGIVAAVVLVAVALARRRRRRWMEQVAQIRAEEQRKEREGKD